MMQLAEGLSMTADRHCNITSKPRTRTDKGVVLKNPAYCAAAVQGGQGALHRAIRRTVKEVRQ